MLWVLAAREMVSHISNTYTVGFLAIFCGTEGRTNRRVRSEEGTESSALDVKRESRGAC